MFRREFTKPSICGGAGGTVRLTVPPLAWDVFPILISLCAAPQHSSIVLCSALDIQRVLVTEWEDAWKLLSGVAGMGKLSLPLLYSLFGTVVLSTVAPVHNLLSLYFGGTPGPVFLLASISDTLVIRFALVIKWENTRDLFLCMTAN